MYREILRLYQEDKKISYHYHSSPYIMIKKFVPHPFWSFCRVVAKACDLNNMQCNDAHRCTAKRCVALRCVGLCCVALRCDLESWIVTESRLHVTF